MKKLMIVPALLLACSSLMAQNNNVLTAREIKDRWILLFDGKTTNGWHSFQKTSVAPGWSATNGTLQLDPKVQDSGGDIVTDGEYDNFELAIDWKIAEEGNSGIIFLVNEDKQYDATYLTGPEYQLLDDKKADDNKKPSHLAASLYDIIPAEKEVELPAGEWNHTIIKLKHGELTFWLNGVQTVKTRLWDTKWDELVAQSKFKTWKGFAAFHKGHIALQNHGYHIEFRNVKIRAI